MKRQQRWSWTLLSLKVKRQQSQQRDLQAQLEQRSGFFKGNWDECGKQQPKFWENSKAAIIQQQTTLKIGTQCVHVVCHLKPYGTYNFWYN